MAIAIDLPAVSQPADSLGELAGSRNHGAAVAECCEVLGRVEAEGTGYTNSANRTAAGGREVGLATIFDDCEVVTCRHRLNGREIGRLSVQVHGQNRAGAG